jgi:hypothetical protein
LRGILELLRFALIALGVVVAGSIAGSMLIFYEWMRMLDSEDPYPTFMTSYPLSHAPFSEFVDKAFPLGSDAKNAISKMTRGGFRVTTSGSDSVVLHWSRHAGPCRELYSIAVKPNADGTIGDITGSVNPICF